jgi:hypothetical protein
VKVAGFSPVPSNLAFNNGIGVNMNNHHRVWVVVVLILAWFIPSSAYAQGQTLIEGVHYLKKKCADHPERTCVQLLNKQGEQIDSESIASLFGLSVYQLRAQNKTKTIPVCRDSLRRNIWHMESIKQPSDRAKQDIWLSCPERDRRVVTVPSELLDVGVVKNQPLFTDIETAMNSASQCGANQSCFLKEMTKVFPELGQAPVSTGAVCPNPNGSPPSSNHPATPSGHSGPPTPPPASATTIAVDHSPSGHGTQAEHSVDIVLVFLTAVSWIAILFLLLSRRRMKEQLEHQKSLVDEKSGDLGKESQEKKGLQAERDDLNRRLTGQKRLLRETLDQQQESHDEALRLKDEDYRALATKSQSATRILERLAQTFASNASRDPQTNLPTFNGIVQGIEEGVIQSILEHAKLRYGSSVNEVNPPRNRREAWNVVQLAERQWFSGHQTMAQQILVLISGEHISVSASRDAKGYQALEQIQKEAQYLLRFIQDEMQRLTTEPMQSSNLTTAIAGLLDLQTRLQEELQGAKQSAADYKSAYTSALKGAGTHPDSESDLGPVSRPADTLPGVQGPANPTTEAARGSSPHASPPTLQLVSSKGGTGGS